MLNYLKEGVAKLNLINYLRTSHKFFEEKLPDFLKNILQKIL